MISSGSYKFCTKGLTGTKILVVENIATTPENELIQDLISIIHIFSCLVYGLRKYKKKLEKRNL
nr:MAG TPA: hypothetical protein [Caudoviricetes sp.]